MAINKAKKVEVVARATEAVKNSATVVFVGFKGMKVVDTTTMRKALKKADVNYTVFKKSLLERALKSAEVTGDKPDLAGEVAVAYSTDALAPGREVFAFLKKFKEHLSIVGGVFDNKYVSKEEMLAIATIPGRQQLVGQFVNLINSPIQGLAVVLSRIAEQKESK